MKSAIGKMLINLWARIRGLQEINWIYIWSGADNRVLSVQFDIILNYQPKILIMLLKEPSICTEKTLFHNQTSKNVIFCGLTSWIVWFQFRLGSGLLFKNSANRLLNWHNWQFDEHLLGRFLKCQHVYSSFKLRITWKLCKEFWIL